MPVFFNIINCVVLENKYSIITYIYTTDEPLVAKQPVLCYALKIEIHPW